MANQNARLIRSRAFACGALLFAIRSLLLRLDGDGLRANRFGLGQRDGEHAVLKFRL